MNVSISLPVAVGSTVSMRQTDVRFLKAINENSESCFFRFSLSASSMHVTVYCASVISTIIIAGAFRESQSAEGTQYTHTIKLIFHNIELHMCCFFEKIWSM